MGDESKKTELLVGLFLFVGLVLLGGLILQFSGVRESLKEKYTLSVTFPSAAGLVKGAPVKLGGASVGEVSKRPMLNEQFNGVVIEMEIFAEYQIPQGSEFLIGSSGLMGDKLLEIKAPKPEALTGSYLKAGAQVAGRGTSGLGAIEEAASSLTEQAEGLLADVELAVQGLTKAIDNFNSGFLAKENAENFSEGLEGLNGSIDKFENKVLGDENLDNVATALEEFRGAAEELKKGVEALRPALEKVDPAMEKLEPTMAKLDETLEKIGEAADALKGTANAATGQIEGAFSGDGLLPALFEDEQLKGEFSALVSNLKKHGVLGYKDSPPNPPAPANLRS